MTNDEFNTKKVTIVIEALLEGSFVEYKSGWTLLHRDGEVYQFFKTDGGDIFHKSEVSLSNFLKFCHSMDIKRVKALFVNTQLLKLQNKLLNDSNG